MKNVWKETLFYKCYNDLMAWFDSVHISSGDVLVFLLDGLCMLLIMFMVGFAMWLVLKLIFGVISFLIEY